MYVKHSPHRLFCFLSPSPCSVPYTRCLETIQTMQRYSMQSRKKQGRKHGGRDNDLRGCQRRNSYKIVTQFLKTTHRSVSLAFWDLHIQNNVIIQKLFAADPSGMHSIHKGAFKILCSISDVLTFRIGRKFKCINWTINMHLILSMKKCISRPTQGIMFWAR